MCEEGRGKATRGGGPLPPGGAPGVAGACLSHCPPQALGILERKEESFWFSAVLAWRRMLTLRKYFEPSWGAVFIGPSSPAWSTVRPSRTDTDIPHTYTCARTIRPDRLQIPFLFRALETGAGPLEDTSRKVWCVG